VALAAFTNEETIAKPAHRFGVHPISRPLRNHPCDRYRNYLTSLLSKLDGNLWDWSWFHWGFGLTVASFRIRFNAEAQRSQRVMFTLLLHKDPVELPECLYKEPVYSLLMIPFKSHL
jgi:hypothetical protein